MLCGIPGAVVLYCSVHCLAVRRGVTGEDVPRSLDLDPTGSPGRSGADLVGRAVERHASPERDAVVAGFRVGADPHEQVWRAGRQHHANHDAGHGPVGHRRIETDDPGHQFAIAGEGLVGELELVGRPTNARAVAPDSPCLHACVVLCTAGRDGTAKVLAGPTGGQLAEERNREDRHQQQRNRIRQLTTHGRPPKRITAATESPCYKLENTSTMPETASRT